MPSAEYKVQVPPPGDGVRIHLIGVGGSGMSGLAHMLLDADYRVSGSDLKAGALVRELEQRGMVFHAGHAEAHAEGASVVVYSSAVPKSNPERDWAVHSGVPVLKRAEMLAELINKRETLLVCGTHGKTTSTMMLAQVLREAGRDPGHYIGADVPDLGAPARLGEGPVAVEGDESDGTISCFSPAQMLLLNIEEDHLDHYHDLSEITAVFRGVVAKAGRAVLCADDAVCRLLSTELKGAVTYALDRDAAWRAVDIKQAADGSSFRVLKNGAEYGTFDLSLPGRHNVSNALGVLAMADGLGVSASDCAAALKNLRGAGRRFDVRHRCGDFLVVDDYAHHPSEIRATLAAARQVSSRRLIALFQPHRYSRTRHLLREFATAFDQADRVFLADIYGAGEENPTGVTSVELAAEIRHPLQVVAAGSLRDAKAAVTAEMEPGDCLLLMGAGDITGLSSEIAGELALYAKLRAELKKESVLRAYEPMSKHTTLRVGGPAQLWCEPSDEEDLSKALAFAKKEGLPVTVIGRGSNLLVRDRGIRGLCVHLGRSGFSGIEVAADGTIRAGAGARLRQIVFEAKKAGLGGVEFMEGIPGNLGGALRMNAGAMQASTFDVVESVRVMDLHGIVHEIPAGEMDVRYRSVPGLSKAIALGAVLRAKSQEAGETDAKLKEYSRKRWDSQPAAPSAGCTFKNAASIPAGKLIDELGLKDLSVGPARVSGVHANFIVNDGGAKAADVLALIEKIRAEALAKRGIELETEVVILGE